MKDEKILVTRSSMPAYEDFIEMIKPIWESHWLTNMGPYHQELENQLKTFLEAKNISLFTNGHMALEMIIQAMNLSGEVITTPFTFASTTHAIVRNGLEPVFCDINRDDYTIDVQKIEKLITPKTCAIIPVHVYGNMCDVEAIEKIAQKYSLKVIYDAAHAFGVKYKGISSANFGDAAMFSFHATKVFNTIEGGAAIFKDDQLGKKLYQLKNFGIKDAEHVIGVGGNAKMNEFQAAMGICNLKYLFKAIEKRKKIVELYNELLFDVKGIKLQKIPEYIESNYAYYPIVIDKDIFGMNRDDVSEILAQKGIMVRKYFYPLTSDFECYADRFKKYDTPVANDVSKNVLCLPLYEDLEEKQVIRICKTIKECYR